MRTIAVAATLLLLSGCATAPRDDWSSKDQKRQMALYAASAGDAVTTARINDPSVIVETGPVAHVFLGDNPNDAQIAAYYAAAAFAYHYLAHRMPPKWRKVFQYVMIYDHAVLGIENNCKEGLCSGHGFANE